ncbi:hypothetical protein TRIUR3_22427 [Triticum urartu]|uniref:Uncharacterized protein n=1 Tax=Triticum urartu TaxID=4572 RepID=M7ZSF5_TRIUA|nr:hypothetical protein TRIUR3_22427 [Triticum urartu]
MVNLFGEVVDNYKLDKMSRYMGKPKNQEDRAGEALNLICEDNKDVKACEYLCLNILFPLHLPRVTHCFIYNATGEPLHYASNTFWSGSFFCDDFYPKWIGNGQWAAFHHRQERFSGSMASVIYRGKNKDGRDQHYLVSWSNPRYFGLNKAYCDIGPVDYFHTRGDDTYNKLLNSGYSSYAQYNGCEIDSKIGNLSGPFFTTKITSLVGHLQHSPKTCMDK